MSGTSSDGRDKPGEAGCTRLARRLFQARTNAVLSRTQAAARVRIADNGISRYERSLSTARREILAKLARIYRRPVSWFHEKNQADPAPGWCLGPDSFWGSGEVETSSVPVIQTIADGANFAFADPPRSWHPFRKDLLARNGVNPGANRLVEALGGFDGAHRHRGALVLVDTSRPDLRDGRLYLMTIAVQRTGIRRVHRMRSSGWCAPITPAGSPGCLTSVGKSTARWGWS